MAKKSDEGDPEEEDRYVITRDVAEVDIGEEDSVRLTIWRRREDGELAIELSKVPATFVSESRDADSSTTVSLVLSVSQDTLDEMIDALVYVRNLMS